MVEELKSALPASELIVDVCRLTKRMETDANLRHWKTSQTKWKRPWFPAKSIMFVWGEYCVPQSHLFRIS